MSIVRLKALATMDWNDMWDVLYSVSSAEVQKIFAEAVQEAEARSKALRYVAEWEQEDMGKWEELSDER